MFGLSGLYLRAAEWIVLVAFLAGTYFWIGNHAVDEYRSEQAVLQAKADSIRQEQYNKLAAEYEVLKTQRAVVTNTITHSVETIVKQPIYQTSCIDKQGLDIANKALRGSLE